MLVKSKKRKNEVWAFSITDYNDDIYNVRCCRSRDEDLENCLYNS